MVTLDLEPRESYCHPLFSCAIPGRQEENAEIAQILPKIRILFGNMNCNKVLKADPGNQDLPLQYTWYLWLLQSYPGNVGRWESAAASGYCCFNPLDELPIGTEH